MNIKRPPLEHIGAEISGIDVSDVIEADVNLIKQIVYENKLVIFRNQTVNTDQYLEFARKIGTPQVYFQDNYHHPDYPEIFVSSNVPKDGKKFGVPGTGQYWHTDYAFFDNPLPLTMLYPQILPNSIRETYYIDMEQVYKKLPPKLKGYVDGKYLIHDGKWRYKVQSWDMDRAIVDILSQLDQEVPPVKHPAVITHPVTHQEILYISQGFTTGIVGIPYEKNREMLQELFSFVEREKYIHTHIWKDGDIILWDNRTLIHKASTVPKGEKSVSYRIGIYDGLPFYITAESLKAHGSTA